MIFSSVKEHRYLWPVRLQCQVLGVSASGFYAWLNRPPSQIVGWAMRDHMRTELPLAALTMAVQRQRPEPGLIHHSDRGSQYASHDYQKSLIAGDITPSMSRKGNCWDNAPMESFFHTLKNELVHHKNYATREDAKRDLFQYIEGFYNRQRIHSSLGYLTPEQMEQKAA